jgi:electron transfer flavoprotein alpha subunit
LANELVITILSIINNAHYLPSVLRLTTHQYIDIKSLKAMNNIFVYLETDEGVVGDVSLELLTKGRSLANQLNCKLEAIAAGEKLDGIAAQVFPYGVEILHLAEDKRLSPYTSLPHTSLLVNSFKEEKPQIALMGATSIGRDLGPRVSSALFSGLTADCTSLEIGTYEDKKAGKTYENLIYQIRPAFGGNIVATIVNPDCRPQMATVREGVMKKEVLDANFKGKVRKLDIAKYVPDTDFVIEVIERHMEKSKLNIKDAPIIVSGGYGVGSADNFKLLHELATVLGGEVGASRAAVDAGFAEHERQIGQTGTTVRPKLYIACGISGQIQHIAGMQESAMIIAINTDPKAPINDIADYVITGSTEEIVPKMIKYYKMNSK